MKGEEKKIVRHKKIDSNAVNESELGGHEQLKTVLVEGGAEELEIENENILEVTSIPEKTGGNGNLFFEIL